MKKVLSIIVSLAMIATVTVTTVSLNSTAAETVESKNPDTTKSCIQAIRDSLTMTWHDEFDGGEDGETIDHSKWLREGSGVHRNGEVHVNADTDDEHNAWIDNGELVFELRKEDRKDVNGELFHYTADSFYTPAKTDHDVGENDDSEVGSFLYGMLEARIKFPDAGLEAQNTNLAFWTTGNNAPEGYTGPTENYWPGCGEIDIAEHFVSDVNIHTKLHYSPNNDGNHDVALFAGYATGDTNDPTETQTADHISGFYHTYGVFWTPDFIMYYVDDAITAIYDITPEQYRCLRECPQQMRIGIAGKMFGEKMDEDFTSAQAYYDYVRVYQAVDENGKSVIDADKAREAYSHIKVLSALNDCVNSKSSTDAGNWQPGGTFKQAFFGAGTNYVTFTTKEKFKPDTYQVYSTGVGAYWYTGKAAYNLNGVDIGAFADYSKATTAETPILIKNEETGEFTNAGTRTATYVDDVSTYLGTAQITGDGGHNLKIGVTNKGNGAQAGGWLLQKAFVLVGKSTNLPDVIVNYDTETPTTTTTTTTTTTQSGETTSSSSTTTTAPAVSDATYENFFYLYDNNGIGTQSHWEDSGTSGKYFSSNAHGMFFPGTTALKLKVKTDLNYDESSSCLNIDWSNVSESNYFLPSAKYKLIVFEYVPKGVAGTYKFSAYEMSQSATYLSGTATELKTVDFANDTPYASYCNGKVLTFDIGEFELKDGASNAIYLTAEQLSGNTLYCCGVAAVPVTPIAKMEAGAEIRLNSVNGIRFLTKFDAAQIQKLQSEGAEVELGTLIAPKDYLKNEDETYKDLTFDLGDGQYVDVQYKAKDKDGSFIWHKDVEGQIAGSLVTIKDTNISREFIGRGYVKVTKDGNTTITYADYQSVDGGEPSMENHFRSLQYVAQKLQSDTEHSDIYEQFKERIDAWAKGEPAPKA